jgi:hypothetical protein
MIQQDGHTGVTSVTSAVHDGARVAMSRHKAINTDHSAALRELRARLGGVHRPGRHVAGPARFDAAVLSDGDRDDVWGLRASTTVGDAIREGALS